MSRLAIGALLLWAVTIAAGAYLFVFGYTTTAPDGRQAVLLSASERDHVLAEMRGLLQAVAQISAALAHDDVAEIAKVARTVGLAATQLESPVLMAKLPLDFKQMGLSIHAGFDEIAAQASAGASAQKITGLLANQLAICAGCHANYRFAQ